MTCPYNKTRAFSAVAHRLNALDIWQPDILRIDGLKAWRNGAALAHVHHISVLPHYYKDHDVPLLCTIPDGTGTGSFDWIDPLIGRPMKIESGVAYVHDRAGWGFNFKDPVLVEV